MSLLVLYKIIEQLGEGGMGVVYLAEQEHPFRRRVALKVIKLGRETGEVIARFEAERQALALMDHQCIAQVYDAGVTTDDRPYFAMEYVPGISITDYCDKHRLPMHARLDLFVQVCGAVQHAHQRGVIHRDIKPSNILVAVQDGIPLPKVIDFGLAKATNQRLTEKTLFTQYGALIGTPAYMSPEQAEMGALAVDTTTDIYSLGVVLYELLIGAPPFDPEILRKAGYAEIQRIIREEEPLRPSARLTSLHASATEVALQRQTNLPTLMRELKGELDWITLKAMDKDRTRRYASASELAADIARHLNLESVIARPPSFTYRARRFVRKHRAALIAVSLVAAASTVISTVVQTQGLLRATVNETIASSERLLNMTFHTMREALRRNPDTPWPEVVIKDQAVRATLESSAYSRSVVDAEVCDMNDRVLISSEDSLNTCPSGRPISELESVSVLTLLRGTIPLRTTHYVASEPLLLGSRNVGIIRVRVAGRLVFDQMLDTLRLALLLWIAQIAAVIVAATVASWVVFRRKAR